MEDVCLEGRWQSRLAGLGWSEESRNLYKHCIAESSLSQYNRYIQQFKTHCLEQGKIFPPEPTNVEATIADYMRLKCESSDRPESMLRSIQAALTHFFMTVLNLNPFQGALKHFVTALIKSQTTKPAGRTKIMPIKPIIDMFKSWATNDTLSIIHLRQKAVTLLAISLMARPSDLAPANELKRSQVFFNADGSLTIQLLGIKNDYKRRGFEVRIDRASNVQVDPVICLKTYIDRSAVDMGHIPDPPLFITAKAPHRALTASAVSQCLRDTLKAAGISDSFTPRSFRPSAASAAVSAGCDPDTARQIYRWKTPEVFYENYVYPVTKDHFTDRIFESNLQLY